MTDLLELVGPLVVGLLTVPIMGWLKAFVTVVDNRGPTFKRVVTVLIALGLTKLGALTGTVLPEGLELFAGEDVESLLSAGIAMAIHAGNKAKEQS